MNQVQQLNRILYDSLVIPDDLALPKELVRVHDRVKISRVWPGGACFLYTVSKTRVYPFWFDLKQLMHEHEENVAEEMRRTIRTAFGLFLQKLQGTTPTKPAVKDSRDWWVQAQNRVTSVVKKK